MPVLVPLTRQALPQGTLLRDNVRGKWLRVDETDNRVRLKIERAVNLDQVTEEVTGHIAPWWNPGDPFEEILEARLYCSYDNARTWERVGTVKTGPEILITQTEPDPDAPTKAVVPTTFTAQLRPQTGNQARLVRYEMDVHRDIETEVELETTDEGLPNTDTPSSNTVGFVASNSGGATSASTVSSGNVNNNSGTNKVSVAFGCQGNGTLATGESMNIDATAATAVHEREYTATAIDSGVYGYILTGITSGAHDADFSVGSSVSSLACHILTFNSVDQTTPTDNVGDTGNGYFPTEVSATATSATDDRVVDCMAAFGYSAPTITGTPATANHRETNTAGALLSTSGDEAGAASVGIGYDYATSPPSTSYVYFNLNDAVAAAGGPRNPLGHPLKGPFGGPIG